MKKQILCLFLLLLLLIQSACGQLPQESTETRDGGVATKKQAQGMA